MNRFFNLKIFTNMKKIMTLAIIALASVAMVSCCGQPKKQGACGEPCCQPKTECVECEKKAECQKVGPQACPQAEVAPEAPAPAPAPAPAQ